MVGCEGLPVGTRQNRRGAHLTSPGKPGRFTSPNPTNGSKSPNVVETLSAHMLSDLVKHQTTRQIRGSRAPAGVVRIRVPASRDAPKAASETVWVRWAGMWFGNVDFPVPLVEAHRDGSLVLFVGAGASKAWPSDLPNFWDLAKGIAGQLHQPWSDSDADHVEAFLGKLDGLDDVDVHQLVAHRIRRSPGPNRLHRRIAALADSAGRLRIVTTNFDRHLTTALDKTRADFEEFRGPALPLGDDFEGLVYLHGNIKQNPRRLVVTDKDFASAYLQQAWAARFLERMFRKYTVLFVGYSHTDTMMYHIGRALSSDNRDRYTLIREDTTDRDFWERRLGIEPITYQVVEGSYQQLGEAIERWTDRATMGVTDHRKRVKYLVRAPDIPRIPEEVSYLEEVLEDPVGVSFFVESARGSEWLQWVAERPAFKRIFDPNLPSAEMHVDGLAVLKLAPEAVGGVKKRSVGSLEVVECLSRWFAKHYAMNPEHNIHEGNALAVARANGGRLSRSLWKSLRLYLPHDLSPDWVKPWLRLLIENATEQDSRGLAFRLLRLDWPRDRVWALLLFDHLTDPRRFTVKRGSSTEDRWLNEAWKNLFKPNLKEAAPDILAIVDRHLRTAYLLQDASETTDGWDDISDSRSAIESHPQDEYSHDLRVLIDAARDCLEELLRSESRLGCLYLVSWANTDLPIFQRLAVHGWSKRSDVDSTEKVGWLLSKGWLLNYETWHEALQLLKQALPNTTNDMYERLVDEAKAGPAAEKDKDALEWAKFSFFGWIAEHAPQPERAKAEFQRIQARHPGWELMENPDFTRWSKGGERHPNFPFPPDELHEMLSDDPDAAVEKLLQYEPLTFPSEGPRWRDVLLLIGETVKKHPEDGFLVLDTPAGPQPDIAKRVVTGWLHATLQPDLIEAIANRLADFDLRSVRREVADLLAIGGSAWRTLLSGRQLAISLWEALSGEGEPKESGWYWSAMSHPAGQLARYWGLAVLEDRKAAGDDWDGLPNQLRTHLDGMLAGDDYRTAMAETVFASQLRFFYDVDSEWCRNQILPLFNWDTPEKAQRAWDGFLTQGRFSDPLLGQGLLDRYIETASQHLDELSEATQRNLYSHLAIIALDGREDPLKWVPTYTARVSREAKVEWARGVARYLGELPDGAADQQWNRWIKQYWQKRIEGIPRTLPLAEASALVGWIVKLEDPMSIAEGVALAKQRPAQLEEDGHLLFELTEGKLDKAPAAYGELVAFLLENTERSSLQGSGGCDDLRKIVARLRELSRTDAIGSIAQSAFTLGCKDALDW